MVADEPFRVCAVGLGEDGGALLVFFALGIPISALYGDRTTARHAMLLATAIIAVFGLLFPMLFQSGHPAIEGDAGAVGHASGDAGEDGGKPDGRGTCRAAAEDESASVRSWVTPASRR